MSGSKGDEEGCKIRYAGSSEGSTISTLYVTSPDKYPAAKSVINN